MIKVCLRVPQQDIDQYGKQSAFCKKLAEWSILPWVDYLYKYGKIVKADHYVDSVYYTDTYSLTWELPPERETFFNLKFSEDIAQVKRLT